jgi:nucleotide-binding universal stress UspA family protein
MGIRDILVHLDTSAASNARLDIAIAYARKHGARLRGLYLITHLFYEPRTIGEKGDSERIEQLFVAKTSEAGISAEWLFQDCSIMGLDVCDLITMQAYYTDLVVLGQPNLSATVVNIPNDLVERVVISSGRPVLVIPYSGVFITAGDRIMIAWKAGRESIRVVNDSLPYLQKAHVIDIVSGKEKGDSPDSTLAFISSFLLNHGIKTSHETISSGSFPIGDMLLNNVCEKKIDLLVMGAFAPNRRGKIEISPVARHVLKHLTTPVLLSH